MNRKLKIEKRKGSEQDVKNGDEEGKWTRSFEWRRGREVKRKLRMEKRKGIES